VLCIDKEGSGKGALDEYEVSAGETGKNYTFPLDHPNISQELSRSQESSECLQFSKRKPKGREEAQQPPAALQ